MTTKELSKLTDEEKRVKIAIATGLWKVRSFGPYNCIVPTGMTEFERGSWGNPHADVSVEPLSIRFTMYAHLQVPDYLNDLNAMHEAEKSLTETQCWDYDKRLCVVVEGGSVIEGWLWRATAAQRADAFLLTNDT